MTFAFVFIAVIQLLLAVLEILMLIRAITSWLPFEEETTWMRFLYLATEPFILPVRKLLERSEAIASLPVDLSFMVTYFLIILISALLPSVRF